MTSSVILSFFDDWNRFEKHLAVRYSHQRESVFSMVKKNTHTYLYL